MISHVFGLVGENTSLLLTTQNLGAAVAQLVEQVDQ